VQQHSLDVVDSVMQI